MIRRLLDAYVDAFESPDTKKPARVEGNRVEQRRREYRKAVPRRKSR